MRVKIYPPDASARAGCVKAPPSCVKAPPSKSMAHRLLICAGLADGISRINGVAPSQDILATRDCLRSLGARVICEGDIWTVEGCDPHRSSAFTDADDDCTAKGCCSQLFNSEYTDTSDTGDTVAECAALRDDEYTEEKGDAGGYPDFCCRESGSTLRFFIPICALGDRTVRFTGSETLMSRPLSVYEELFAARGLLFERDPAGLRVCGPLEPGEYSMSGSISSQFVSGMLFALSVSQGDSIIRLIPPASSRPYIDMTVAALRDFGADVCWLDETSLRIRGRERLEARDLTVEGDWSNAAFLLAMGAEVTGLRQDSLQGDKVCVDLFRQLDAGRSEIDISDCPDLGPVLMAYAAMHCGAVLHGAGRLRIKESDRGAAMKEELAKFGVDVRIDGDDITVGCGIRPPDSVLCGHNDHRIVMSMAVLCSKTGGTIDGAEAVNKSYPAFFEDIGQLGIRMATQI